jgi:hypothetical protein
MALAVVVSRVHLDELVQFVVVMDQTVVTVFRSQRLFAQQFSCHYVEPVHSAWTRKAKKYLAVGSPLRHLTNKFLRVLVLLEGLTFFPDERDLTSIRKHRQIVLIFGRFVDLVYVDDDGDFLGRRILSLDLVAGKDVKVLSVRNHRHLNMAQLLIPIWLAR